MKVMPVLFYFALQIPKTWAVEYNQKQKEWGVPSPKF